ncbi:unnamed protein product [Penicillium glandicola]
MPSNTNNIPNADIIATIIPEIELGQIPNAKSKQDDPFLVAFAEPFDPENPKDWPTGRKWAVTDVLSATVFNRIMVSTIMAPALSTIAREFDMNSAESAMALSIYLLATVFGPLIIGPLSEFLIWNVTCGFANSKEMLIASRFLAGFGASAIYALASGVLGDVWRPEQRGRSLGAQVLLSEDSWLLAPLGDGCSGLHRFFQAVMVLVSFTAFHETHEPRILRSRAERLRQETENQQYYTEDERLHANKSPYFMIGRALMRPQQLLAFHPVIQIASAISAFYYGILYIVLSTFSDLWTKQYGQSVEISGLHYIACAFGTIVGGQIGAKAMDYLYRRQGSRSNAEHVPESRISLIFPGALLGPVGLFVYGWAAQNRLHWIVVDIGIFISMLGMQMTGLPLQAYLMESYPKHASSAGAASQFMRSLTAFLFPLFAPKMYEVLGYGWGNSTIGFTGLIFGLPAPLALIYFGATLRAKARSSF